MSSSNSNARNENNEGMRLEEQQQLSPSEQSSTPVPRDEESPLLLPVALSPPTDNPGRVDVHETGVDLELQQPFEEEEEEESAYHSPLEEELYPSEQTHNNYRWQRNNDIRTTRCYTKSESSIISEYNDVGTSSNRSFNTTTTTINNAYAHWSPDTTMVDARRRRRGGVPSVTSTNSSNSTTSSARRRTRSSLRERLDAGMATLKLWIRSHNTPRGTNSTMLEEIYEEEEATARQRTLSEPNVRLPVRRWRTDSEDMTRLSSRAAATLYANHETGNSSIRRNNISNHMPFREDVGNGIETVFPVETNALATPEHSNDVTTTLPPDDPERHARLRWIQINRRFQFVITVVALLFSLLLFSILICWVVLTSAYVLNFDKPCDVPLKPYFWLVTLQLILDVFRSDIMRFVFDWDANANQRIPFRVIAYNLAYLLYALLVLRLGIQSVFVNETTCDDTAAELFRASTAFVSMSIAAWSLILCGYLLPFCVVAALLTYNGYNPSNELSERQNGATAAVFPAAYSNSGAPPGCIELLNVVPMDSFPPDYPRECCICMENFDRDDAVVETACKHIFHKPCCREWLRQSRTCPVCRTDIPVSMGLSLGASSEGIALQAQPNSRIPLGPTGRPVRGLIHILQSQSSDISLNGGRLQEVETRLRERSATAASQSSTTPHSLEEGRVNRAYTR